MTKHEWSEVLVYIGTAFALCGAAAMAFNDWTVSAVCWMLCSQANNSALWLERREAK